jgi:hypothetical protein
MFRVCQDIALDVLAREQRLFVDVWRVGVEDAVHIFVAHYRPVLPSHTYVQ